MDTDEKDNIVEDGDESSNKAINTRIILIIINYICQPLEQNKRLMFKGALDDSEV